MAATLRQSTENVMWRASSSMLSSNYDGASTTVKQLGPTLVIGSGKRLPHPVVFRILARRRLKAAAAKRRHIDKQQAARRQEQQAAALEAELTWQRETPLVFENVARLYPDMRDEVLGNRIFRLIELTDACHPGKVTGMILEGFSTRELFDLLHIEAEVKVASSILALVAEAHEVLRMSEENHRHFESKEKGGVASAAVENAAAAPTELVSTERDECVVERDEWQVGRDEWQVERDEWQVVEPKRRRSPSTP